MGISMDLFSNFLYDGFVLSVAAGGTPGGCGFRLRLSNGS